MSDRLEQDLEELLARRAASTDAELEAQRAAIAGLPSRGRRWPALAWAAAIVIAAGLGGLAVWRFGSSVAAPPPTGMPSIEPSAPAATAAAVASPSPATPGWATTLVSQLHCKWPVAPIGEASGDAPIGGAVGASAQEALEGFLASAARTYATLPLTGYVALDDGPDWSQFASLRDGQPVVLIAMQRVSAGWVPFQLAACDRADFDQTLPTTGFGRGWVDAMGARVEPRAVLERLDCRGTERLLVDGRLYVRNLFGGSYAPETLFTTFAADATLPPNAVDTGYWLGKTHLYASADGTSVYLASPLRVERWPRVRGDQVMPDPCP